MMRCSSSVKGVATTCSGEAGSPPTRSLASPDAFTPLPQATISYYRRHRIVPSLAVHLLSTEGMSDAELQAACGGLEYAPTLVRPTYAFQRKPADKSTRDVLTRLPRE